MIYQQNGSIFAICRPFTDITISAARWLTKFNHEMKEYRNSDDIISFDIYLENFQILLNDDVVDWVESYLDVI